MNDVSHCGSRYCMYATCLVLVLSSFTDKIYTRFNRLPFPFVVKERTNTGFRNMKPILANTRYMLHEKWLILIK